MNKQDTCEDSNHILCDPLALPLHVVPSVVGALSG